MSCASSRTSGRFVTTTGAGESVRAFVPAPLPPAPSELDLVSLLGLLTSAERALGRLDGIRVFGYRQYLAILGEGT